ncbi:MAG TPA: MOSC N-terminal beta barrel domain-containing protein [Solirubrobacteraceae bacterium]|nr:MOSC N-terminal beta barrel domain-containing protein [Solirubrobacteraceae bacterium]
MTTSVRGGHDAARIGPEVATVTALFTVPVKGLRLQSREALRLETTGAVDDRRFFLITHDDRMVNARRLRMLCNLVAGYDPVSRWLTVLFPDGKAVEGPVQLGQRLSPQFFAREIPASLVIGPWAHALSIYTGRSLRLVMVADDTPGTDRGFEGTVSLISRATIVRLEQEAGQAVDPRRFRMLIEVDGIDAHEEDSWVGRQLQIGGATVLFNGHVGRCIVTGLDPDTGRGDMPTLELLSHYRMQLDTTETLALGVFGGVLAPGLLRRGDPVALVE